MSFGELVKTLRLAQQRTLRQFCLEHGHDPSNWSKVERGVNGPPRDQKTLAHWARQLGLAPGTDAWEDFMIQADVSNGRIPRQVMDDAQLLSKLPVFFRTVRGAEFKPESIEGFIRKVREIHSPDLKAPVAKETCA